MTAEVPSGAHRRSRKDSQPADKESAGLEGWFAKQQGQAGSDGAPEAGCGLEQSGPFPLTILQGQIRRAPEFDSGLVQAAGICQNESFVLPDGAVNVCEMLESPLVGLVLPTRAAYVPL